MMYYNSITKNNHGANMNDQNFNVLSDGESTVPMCRYCEETAIEPCPLCGSYVCEECECDCIEQAAEYSNQINALPFED